MEWSIARRRDVRSLGQGLRAVLVMMKPGIELSLCVGNPVGGSGKAGGLLTTSFTLLSGGVGSIWVTGGSGVTSGPSVSWWESCSS